MTDTFLKLAEKIEAQGKDKWLEQGMEKGMKQGMKQGMEKGVKKGRKEGQAESKVEFALKLIERGGMEVEEIADLTGLTVKNVQKLVEQKVA